MKIGNPFRSELGGVSEWINQALDSITARINAVFSVEHNDDGTHGTLSVSESFTTSNVQWHAFEGFVTTFNNFALLDDTTVLEIEPAGDVTFTGFAGGWVGRRIVLINVQVSVDAVILSLDDAASTSTNRIRGDAALGGSTIEIEPGRGVELIYSEARNSPGWHALVKA